MLGSGAVKAFEPVLIEERGERRLAEPRLPDDPEQRGRRLIRLALQQRDGRRTISCGTIDRVWTGPEAELDKASPFGRSQREMGNLVQDHIGFRRRAKRGSVP